jgi:hypothetical protein
MDNISSSGWCINKIFFFFAYGYSLCIVLLESNVINDENKNMGCKIMILCL